MLAHLNSMDRMATHSCVECILVWPFSIRFTIVRRRKHVCCLLIGARATPTERAAPAGTRMHARRMRRRARARGTPRIVPPREPDSY